MTMYQRLLPKEQVVANECQKEVRAAMQTVLDEALALLDKKGETYDQHGPMWHRMQFGEVDFSVLDGLKARRAGAVLIAPPEAIQEEEIDSILHDLLNFTLVWAAWRKVSRTQAALLNVEDEPAVPKPAPVAARPTLLRRS